MERFNRHNETSSAHDDDSDTVQLERERYNNDQKLKARFEHIFLKYEHDFSGIGDEIDLASGEIVVNNGHLQYMRHEVDPGKSASSRFVKTFQEKLEEEEDGTSDEDEHVETGQDYEDDGDSDEDGDISSENDSRFDTPSVARQPALLQAFGNLRRPAPRLARILVDEGTPQRPIDLIGVPDMDDTLSVESVSDTPTSSNLLNQVPDIQKSMRSFKTIEKQPTVDDDAIQALGVSIANQLAQLMAGSAKRKNKKSKTSRTSRTHNFDPAWAYPEFNSRTPRPKRRRSLSPAAVLPTDSPTSRSPGEESLWALESSARPKRRRTLHSGTHPGTSGTVRPIIVSTGGHSDRNDVKRCWNCSLTNTPGWRKGPHGQNLCSSCGKYFDINQRMKPFDSPTPSIEEEEEMGVTVADDSVPFVQSIGELPKHSGQPLLINADDTLENHDRSDDVPQEDDSDAKPEGRTPDTGPHTPSSAYLANTSRPLTGSPPTSSTRIAWTAHDDAILIKLKEYEKMPWPSIARQFADRTLWSIQRRYSHELRQGHSEGRELLRKHPDQVKIKTEGQVDSDLRADRAWNEDQDKLLLELRDSRQLSWDEISGLLPGHAAEAVMERYKLLAAVMPGHRGPTPIKVEDRITSRSAHFTAEEDALLVRLKEFENLAWTEIAKRYPQREMSSMQKRYSSYLAPRKRKVLRTSAKGPARGTIEDRILAVDPELSGDASTKPFDSAEDALVKELKEQQNLEWEAIAAKVPGRSVELLKRRYEYKTRDALMGFLTPEKEGIAHAILPAPSPVIDSLTLWMRPLRFTNDKQGNQHGVFRLERCSGSKQLNSEFQSVHDSSPTPANDPAIPMVEPIPQQSDGRAKPGPGSRKPFTNAEDDLILRLRSVGGDSWEDIAFSLPGRSVRSIIARHQEIIGRTQPKTPLKSTWKSVQTPSTQATGLRKRKSPPSRLPSSSRSNANPLLRKALDNSLRRRSDQTQLAVQTTAVASAILDDPKPDKLLQVASTVPTQQKTPSLVSDVEQIYREDQGDVHPQSSVDVTPKPTPSNTNAPSLTIDPTTTVPLSVGSRGLGDRDSETENPQGNRTNLNNFMTENTHIRTEDANPFEKSENINKARGETLTVPASPKLDHNQRLLDGSAPVASPRRTMRASATQVTARSKLLPAFEEQSRQRPSSSSSPDDELLGNCSRPELSFCQLVRVAFEASGSRIMRREDIYEWVESNYEFYRLSPPSWKARIRAELSANPSFTRTTTEEGVIAWQLVNSAQSDGSWGLTRGPRRKRRRASRELGSGLQTPMPMKDSHDLREVHAGLDKSDRMPVSAPLQPSRLPQQADITKGSKASTTDAEVTSVKAPADDNDDCQNMLGRSQHKTRTPAKTVLRTAKEAMSKRIRMFKSAIDISNSDPEDGELPVDMTDDELLQPSSPPIKHEEPSSSFDYDPESSLGRPEKATPRFRWSIAQSSSSPIFVKPSTPASVYSELSTPRDGHGNAAAARQGTPLGMMGRPAAFFVSRSTAAPAGISSMRCAETPVREVDLDEDELA